MCGSAAVPTIRQNTSARKLRRETSRAVSSLPGNTSACRSGGAARAPARASLVHCALAAAASVGYAATAFSAAATWSAGAFSALSFSRVAVSSCLPVSNDAGRPLTLALASSARALKIARTSSSFGSLRNFSSSAVTFWSCWPYTSCGIGTPVCFTDSQITGIM